MLNRPLSNIQNLSIIVGGVLLVFPVVWVARKMLDKQPAMSRAVWVTTFVHFALGFLSQISILNSTCESLDVGCHQY
jgi:hypothetical protein